MDSSKFSVIFFALFAITLVYSVHANDAASEENEVDPEVDTEQLEYAKGSLCGYCDYCKFCKLCDADCPCETGPTKPNCHMCKYCKYCYLCKACDTICQPGGIIDKVTAAVVSALPTFSRDEVDGDIESMKDWIDAKKDEL